MASLMPLQRSVTPWKVSGRSRHVMMMMMSFSHYNHIYVFMWMCSDSAADPPLQSG